MVCVYVTNERMTTMITDITDTLTTNVDDLTKYTNNTINVSPLESDTRNSFESDSSTAFTT